MQKKAFTFGEKLVQEISLLRAREDFMSDVKEIQYKYGFPIAMKDRSEFESDVECDYWYEQIASINCSKEVDKLIEKYNLMVVHDPFLNTFIKFGILESNPDKFVEKFYLNGWFKIVDDEKNYINLQIYPGTTIKDIQKRWPDIKEALDRMRKTGSRKNRSKNIDRDLEIKKLRNEGKTCTKIAKMINLDERFKDNKITYQEVSRIISRLKNKAKRNVPNKES
jgi:hypothetical protein